MDESRFEPMKPVTGRRKTEDETGDPMHDYEEIDQVHREVAAVAAETGTYHQQYEWPTGPATETATMPVGELRRPGTVTIPPVEISIDDAAKILARRFGASGARTVADSAVVGELQRAMVEGQANPVRLWVQRLEDLRL